VRHDSAPCAADALTWRAEPLMICLAYEMLVGAPGGRLAKSAQPRPCCMPAQLPLNSFQRFGVVPGASEDRLKAGLRTRREPVGSPAFRRSSGAMLRIAESYLAKFAPVNSRRLWENHQRPGELEFAGANLRPYSQSVPAQSGAERHAPSRAAGIAQTCQMVTGTQRREKWEC